jgi:hypothetical protein
VARVGRLAHHGWASGLCALLLVALAPSAASAEQVHLRSDTTFRLYEVRSPITPVVWTRRRLVQTLGVTWGRQLGKWDDRPIRLVTNLDLRLDQNFGQTCFIEADGCVQATNPSDEGEFQPLAANGRIDAPGAWVEARGLPGDTRVRLGRQLRTSPIGFVRIDGVQVHTEPHPWVSAEAFGGAVVRRTSLAGSDGFAPNGSLRLELPDDVDPSRAPYVAPPSRTWTVGAQLEAGRTDRVRAQAGFREMFDGSGVVSRRLSVGLVSEPLRALRLEAGGVWDLLDGTLIDARIQANVDAGPVTVRGSVSRHVPRFDIGTIWAWFDVVPVDHARLGGTWRVGRDFSVTLQGHARRADLGEQGVEVDGGFEVRARLERAPWKAQFRVRTEDGDLGPVAAVRIAAQRYVTRWLEITARASVWHFDDPLRQGMYGTSITEALGARFRVTENTLFHLDLQHTHSRVVGHRFQGLTGLAFEVWR